MGVLHFFVFLQKHVFLPSFPPTAFPTFSLGFDLIQVLFLVDDKTSVHH
jgi:hypothetical protein